MQSATDEQRNNQLRLESYLNSTARSLLSFIHGLYVHLSTYAWFSLLTCFPLLFISPSSLWKKESKAHHFKCGFGLPLLCQDSLIFLVELEWEQRALSFKVFSRTAQSASFYRSRYTYSSFNIYFYVFGLLFRVSDV